MTNAKCLKRRINYEHFKHFFADAQVFIEKNVVSSYL